LSKFAHLHLHTQYSLLDGVNKIPQVLERAYALGQPAIAMTDHGNMHGAIEFYEAAKKVGIKPILGCELYVTPGSRFEKKPKNQGGAGTFHITALAKSNQGYTNLCRLVSSAYSEGFYFKPRVDHELFRECNKDLVILSGCLASELASFVERDDIEGARQLARFYRDLFGESYYLETQPHQVFEQRKLNQACYELAKELGIPLVATTDCHYLAEEDHFAQEVLMCISMGKQITDPDRIKHEGVKLHLKSYDEMRAELGAENWVEEALANTALIAEQCNLKFEFNKHYMPRYRFEDGAELNDDQICEHVGQLARAGLRQRLDLISSQADWDKNTESQYHERLDLELKLISKMGFDGYFLVVADFINWAKQHDIPVGPGRGSAAGSLVAYAMRITDIDPIKNKLLFERFLNPERVSLPDIDVDFCIDGRDAVLDYVVQKYGRDRVAQICTFGTMKAKAAIKDVGRALGTPYQETDRVAQLVPAPRQGFDFSLEESMKMEKRLAEYAEGEGRQLIELALKLEGLTRHSSTHAAGVVIGDRPLVEFLPMMKDKEGHDVTQFVGKYVEKIGLVKFDFLGLKTLTVIKTAVQLISENRKIKIDPARLPLEDAKTYSLLCAGHTTGVFQLESSGITEITMRLKPSCFDDLVAILALYRPGPLDAGMVDHYINRKHGREPVTYLHPLMSTILQDTYGIIVYQEQIMQLAQELAGYSLGEADLLRRAMGKKVPEEMAAQRERFVSGAIKKGLDRKLATEIFDQMETFARYGFNRSHSAAYAMISFQTAYLRAHYPVEFMAALMTHEMDDTDKVFKNLTECRKHKIVVAPPDINASVARFSVQGDVIRYGLSAVKGVGDKAVTSIVEVRDQDGPFKDLETFVERIDLSAVNRRVLENFIKCGVFDSTGFTRNELMSRLEDVLRYGAAMKRDVDANQIDLFSGDVKALSIPRRSGNRPEWTGTQKLAFEREALGFYISGHPLLKFEGTLKKMGADTVAQLKERKNSGEVKVGGVVNALRLRNTKKGDRYASFLFEDWTGSIEALVWPDVYSQISSLLVSEEPFLAMGKLDVRDERSNLILNKLEPLAKLREQKATQGLLAFTEADDIDANMDGLLQILNRYRGTCPLKASFKLDGQMVEIMLRDANNAPVSVMPSEDLCEQVEQLFGRAVLSFI
jgi:DNA polymerase III subunit alpha